MKTFQNFIDESLIREQEINEGFLQKLGNLFKAGAKAYKNSLKSMFANAYPNWIKEYDKLQNESDEEKVIEGIKKTIEAVDNMDPKKLGKDQLTDEDKASYKLVTLSGFKETANKKKQTKVEKFCDEQIAAINKEVPEAVKQAEEMLKNGSEENNNGMSEEEKKKAAEAVNKTVDTVSQTTGVDKDTLANSVKKFLTVESFNDINLSINEGLDPQKLKAWITTKGKEEKRIAIITNIIASIKALANELNQKKLAAVAPIIEIILKDETLNASLNGEQQNQAA